MKMSRKLMLLFSLLAVMTTAANSAYFLVSRMDSLRETTFDTLSALGSKIKGELEQYIQLMDYALDELTSNVDFMNAMHLVCARQSSDDIGEMLASQTVMSRILYQEPLLENFYRVSAYAPNGFFISSHFEKTDTVVSLSDEAIEAVASLPYLQQVDADPFKRHLIGPHHDPWSSMRDIPVFTAVRTVIWHGECIGYIEVSSQLDELFRIFTVQGIDGFLAHAVFEDGEQLFRTFGDDAVYTDLDPDGMTHCKMADGTERLVVGMYSKTLGVHIYVSQDFSVYNQKARALLITYIGVSCAILAITLLFIAGSSLGLTRSVRKLTDKVMHLPVDHLLARGDDDQNTVVTRPSDYEIYHLEQVFNDLFTRLKRSMHNELTLREGALQAHFNALQTQINPHFVYNTLNIISAKGLESGSEEIVEICDQFAQMLRYSTDVRSRTATLGDEINQARRYLMLAKSRYEDALVYEIDVPDEMESLLIPKLTLQPVIENALTHGFSGRTDRREIRMIGVIDAGALRLTLRDNGNGFPPDVLAKLNDAFRRIDREQGATAEESGGHIGLINTYLRLHYYSHGKMLMTLRNDSGAVVEMIFPLKRSENDV